MIDVVCADWGVKKQRLLTDLVSPKQLWLFVCLVTCVAYLISITNFVTVAERSRWLRSCWRTGCRCACIHISKHTLTSRCSCSTKRSSTRLRKDQLTPWRPRQDTHCLRTGCYERRQRLEHWSASLSCTVTFYSLASLGEEMYGIWGGGLQTKR